MYGQVSWSAKAGSTSLRMPQSSLARVFPWTSRKSIMTINVECCRGMTTQTLMSVGLGPTKSQKWSGSSSSSMTFLRSKHIETLRALLHIDPLVSTLTWKREINLKQHPIVKCSHGGSTVTEYRILSLEGSIWFSDARNCGNDSEIWQLGWIIQWLTKPRRSHIAWKFIASLFWWENTWLIQIEVTQSLFAESHRRGIQNFACEGFTRL